MGPAGIRRVDVVHPLSRKRSVIFLPSPKQELLALTACYTQKQCRASYAEMSSQMAVPKCHRAILREGIGLQCWVQSQNFRKRDYFGPPKKSLPEFLIVFSLSWCTTPLPLNQSGFNCIQCLAQGARSTALGAEGSSLAAR